MKKIEELKSIDLRKCSTVGDIVSAMKYCSFGARMLGEVSWKLCEWIESQIKNEKECIVVYDGRLDTSLGRLLISAKQRGWFADIILPETYHHYYMSSEHNLLVIGAYSDRFKEALYAKTKTNEVIFVNQFGLADSNIVKDGWFKNVVFADPQFIMPLLLAVVEEKIDKKKISATELIASLSFHNGLAKEISDGAKTFKAMINDRNCTVFLTLSGAMTIAKMSLIICDMIDMGMVQGIASTGALMAHGLIESLGLKHFKYNPKISDRDLAKRCLNRVTDTLEPETNFDQVDETLDKILSKFGRNPKPISPIVFHRMVGKYLAEKYPKERGVLKSAYEKSVPVFVPAFTDSEIGNDFYVYNILRKRSGKKPIVVNLEHDTEFLVNMAVKSKKMGIFTIGGGVPRNNIQNVAPLLEIMKNRLGDKNLPLRQFSYGCRIAPDSMWYGHLSGCTYSEGKSWRKMDVNGKFSEIHTDATIALPFMVKYVMEAL